MRPDGVNFSLHAPDAAAVELVLFDEAGERATITPQERTIARNILRFTETTAEDLTPGFCLFVAFAVLDSAEALGVVAEMLTALGGSPVSVDEYRFSDHPDLRRLMMPEDWQGHPLHKDYAIDTAHAPWR